MRQSCAVLHFKKNIFPAKHAIASQVSLEEHVFRPSHKRLLNREQHFFRKLS